MIGIVTGSAKKPSLDDEKENDPLVSDLGKEKVTNMNDASSPSLEATETTANKPQHETRPNDDENGSLSSLSFYEDFPTLYFAIRKGRYVNNTVMLSWESARKQIVGYPEAEYIATPTLEQAHRYTNSFGEFEKSETRQNHETPAAPSQKPKAKANPKKDDPRKHTTRSLLLEYYESYDPGWKEKGKKPLKIAKFLKRRKMYKSKRLVFVKHWQRSGIMMMRNDEKPLEEAIAKYDRWVEERKQNADHEALEEIKWTDRKKKRPVLNGNEDLETKEPTSRKRKRPPADDSSNSTADQPNPPSADSSYTDSKEAKKQKPQPRSSKTTEVANAKAKAAPNKTKKQKSTPTEANVQDDEAELITEKWMTKYENLKAFQKKHGTCYARHKEDATLYSFYQYTRRRMFRQGGRPLSLREEDMLNEIDFDPLFKKISTKFRKFRGKRIVKLFQTEVETADGSTVVQKKPYFGTVGYISDVYKQVSALFAVCGNYRFRYGLLILFFHCSSIC